MKNYVRKLEWDSSFFGKKVASILLCDGDISFLEEGLRVCRNEGYELVYVFCENNMQIPSNILQYDDCSLVDTRITFEFQVNSPAISHPNIFECYLQSPDLYNLAIQSGVYSCFRIDHHFTKQDFERLYKVWVDSSLNRTIADSVLVYSENNELAGFVTMKNLKDRVSIGLIATQFQYRGRGIASFLLNSVNNYAYSHAIDTIEVATQARNIIACSFYKKNGFIEKSRTNIYHFWI